MAVQHVRLGDVLELQRRKVTLDAAEQYVEVNLSPLNDDKLTDAIKLEFAPYIESGLLPPGTEIYARRCGSRIDVCGTLSL